MLNEAEAMFMDSYHCNGRLVRRDAILVEQTTVLLDSFPTDGPVLWKVIHEHNTLAIPFLWG